MTDKLTYIQRRAFQYWFVDGLAEIAMGLMLLMLGVLFAFWEVIFTKPWGVLVVLVVGLPVSYGVRRIIQQIKERSTYPRTGYAAPLSGLENKSSLAIAVVFALLLLALNLFVTLRGSVGWNWSTLFAGLVAGFVLGWTGYVARLRRLYFLALAAIAAGILLALLGFKDLLGSGILIGLLGLALLGMGIRTRLLYLRQNPPLES